MRFNYGYHLARAHARLVQGAYEQFLPLIIGHKIRCARQMPVDVFAYSGERRLAEQVASIRSFLKNAGQPNRFVVVSDGTHSSKSMDLVRRIDDCVSVDPVAAPDVTACQ